MDQSGLPRCQAGARRQCGRGDAAVSCGRDETADLTWEAPDDLATAHGEALQQLPADRAGDEAMVGELAE